MCSAGVVGRQDDDVDVVEQEHQTLACSSSLILRCFAVLASVRHDTKLGNDDPLRNAFENVDNCE